jgi:hypothetical protein
MEKKTLSEIKELDRSQTRNFLKGESMSKKEFSSADFVEVEPYERNGKTVQGYVRRVGGGEATPEETEKFYAEKYAESSLQKKDSKIFKAPDISEDFKKKSQKISGFAAELFHGAANAPEGFSREVLEDAALDIEEVLEPADSLTSESFAKQQERLEDLAQDFNERGHAAESEGAWKEARTLRYISENLKDSL